MGRNRQTIMRSFPCLFLLGASLLLQGQTTDVEGARRIPIKNRPVAIKPGQELNREMPGNAPIKSLDFQRYEAEAIARASAASPEDYMLYTEEGDTIEVRHELFHTGASLDRCEVVFQLASSIRIPKIFVLSQEPFLVDPRKPGAVKKTILTGFDYESFDKKRPSTVDGNRRNRPFFRRSTPAQNTQRQIAFHRTGELLKSTRVHIKNRAPLGDVYSTVDIGRETSIRLYPGYRVILTWMTE